MIAFEHFVHSGATLVRTHCAVRRHDLATRNALSGGISTTRAELMPTFHPRSSIIRFAIAIATGLLLLYANTAG